MSLLRMAFLGIAAVAAEERNLRIISVFREARETFKIYIIVTRLFNYYRSSRVIIFIISIYLLWQVSFFHGFSIKVIFPKKHPKMAASSKPNTNANTSSNSSFSIIQSLIMLPSVTTAAPKQLAASTDATSTAQSLANTVAIPTFKFEDFIENSLKINLKKPDNVEICQYYLKNQCRLGRHNQIRGKGDGNTNHLSGSCRSAMCL